MIRNFLKRMLYGILFAIPLILLIGLSIYLPVVLLIAAIFAIVYLAGSMIDDELKYRKADWHELDRRDT